jgi:ATP-binding cassette, subfamily B, bacterial CvaB/MchF/RaxB
VIGPRGYRPHVGALMQEDQLLSGSIADDICFFASFDQPRMIECAQIAAIFGDADDLQRPDGDMEARSGLFSL